MIGVKVMKKPTAGELIRNERKLRGISISKLAELSGVSQPYISQIESDKRKPSYEIIRKIIGVLNIDFHLLSWASELYTDEEYQDYLNQKNYFESMTPEEREMHTEEQVEDFNYFQKLSLFQKRKYVQIEDFLNNSRESIYINKHKLTVSEIKALISLFEDKEKNYPSDSTIEQEFEKLRNERKEAKQKEKTGESIIVLDSHFDYDLD